MIEARPGEEKCFLLPIGEPLETVFVTPVLHALYSVGEESDDLYIKESTLSSETRQLLAILRKLWKSPPPLVQMVAPESASELDSILRDDGVQLGGNGGYGSRSR